MIQFGEARSGRWRVASVEEATSPECCGRHVDEGSDLRRRLAPLGIQHVGGQRRLLVVGQHDLQLTFEQGGMDRQALVLPEAPLRRRPAARP